MSARLSRPRDPLPRAIATWHAEGGTVVRDGRSVRLLTPTPHSASGQAALGLVSNHGNHALQAHQDALGRLCIPSVTDEQARQVHAVLAAAGASVAYVTDPAQAARAVTELMNEYRAELTEQGSAVIGLDMETEVLADLRAPIPVRFTKQGQLAKRQLDDGIAGTALDPFSSRVRLCQMWVTGAVRVFDMRKVSWSSFAPLLTDPTINWAAFNAVFEAKRLIHETGAMPAGRMFDAMTAVWLTHGQRPNLEDAAKLVFELSVPKVLGSSDWSADTLSPEQLDYAALDAVLAAALWHDQRTYFAAEHPDGEHAQQVADDAIEAVARMELYGITFDRNAHLDQVNTWEAELATGKAAREAATPGLDWSKRNQVQEHLTRELLGVGPDAMDAWPRTKTGLLSTDRASLVQGQGIVSGITEHLSVSKLEKLLNSFGRKLPARINPRTGRLHTSLLIAGARTGRFSSREPNLQQMPKVRSRGFRQAFVAEPGKLLMAADYSQIELRAVAEVIFATVGESTLRQGFVAGIDAHKTTAMALTGKTKVTSNERDQAKAPNFGLHYGMGRRGFFRYVRDQYQPDITEDAAYDLYDAFHGAMPELGAWHDQHERLCRQDGYVETPLGRRWYWHWRARDEDEIDYDAGFVEDQRSGFQRNFAFNHVIQGGCAEVMLIALARLDRALRPYPAHLVLTVHDEVLIELAMDPTMIVAVRDIVVTEMTAAFLAVFPDAPTLHLVEPTIGPSWGEQVNVDKWLSEHTPFSAAVGA
jgi:DNA polymerase-1